MLTCECGDLSHARAFFPPVLELVGGWGCRLAYSFTAHAHMYTIGVDIDGCFEYARARSF